MAANLPDDVVLLILEQLAHPAHTPESYRDRQNPLRNVCLASRRLRHLARPLLWRQVAVRSPRHLNCLPASLLAVVLGRHTRSYTVVGSVILDLADAVGVSDLLPEVVDLHLTSAPLVSFKLCLLEPFAHLRRLHLGLAHLPRDALATLPVLEELCVRQIWCTTRELHAQLLPARVPRLRELHLVQVKDMTSPTTVQLADVVPPDLLPQLDLVQTDSASIDPTSDLAQSLAPPVLVFGPPAAATGPPRPLPRHSISQPARFKDARTATDTLAKLAASTRLVPIRHMRDPPYLVLLPLALRTLAAAEPSVAPHLAALEALFAEKRVVVEWTEDLPEGELVSPEFRRHARELRAARALEGE
ncbi:uncharacterized protein RHOBADRAFT_51453 [Rhodotorula graminis WP1]|uniref:F-box domain-containing protein n=1 Tax=Rhodotorula graminis (strain WP1) TaxID=578459 RepID=A0A194SAI7_RHOGW|nr:uncharacterized protein RHOBADRAFT_51453 [Rhodotorula graminis WP1]KPV77622.1 hypothetical protein RHOBADRAFT_51453 [Rhodotorula graminis WP1]